MNKKYIKYINYIINDLVDETIIDMDGRYYMFPFIMGRVKWNMDVMDLTTPIEESGTNENLHHNFSIYVKDMYGVEDREVDLLWDKYVKEVSR